MQKDQQLKKPFFSNFMEQQLDRQAGDAVGAGPNQTQKYPSDKEDDYTKPTLDTAQTQKFPSDGDDDVQSQPL